MSITTNLSVSPYFDDYDDDKNYYRILFRPSVPVQVRELNQLQSILQKQIERFGDVVVTRGSILSGCQPKFHTSIPYIKIKDVTANGSAVSVEDYVGLSVVNSSNLISRVILTERGLETEDPDLNTLYLSYYNSGISGEETNYLEGSVLTLYNDDRRLHGISIENSSQGFTNTDTVVILSAIQVQNTTGGTTFSNVFEVGETLNFPTSNATVEIISVDTTSNTEYYNIRVKPLSSQLSIANTKSWELETGTNFVTSNSSIDGTLARIVGNGANAEIVTTNLGSIQSISLNQQGSGYKIVPHVTISTKSASQSQIDQLNLNARNFLSKVTVASGLNQPTVGVSYHMDITGGTIYQNGHFLNVNGQSLIVDKYANTPNSVVVGFETIENIVDSSADSTLVDNASGFLNENAPGAHRLSLEPTLSLRSIEEGENDPNFYSLFRFSNGKVFSQRTEPQFNKINDLLAKRTYEESGNYVLDRFSLTTNSLENISDSQNSFTYVIDPGTAYIAGYRVETRRPYNQNVSKNSLFESVSNNSIDVDYGNYIRVNEFAGIHLFLTGDQISLQSEPAKYLSTLLDDTEEAPGIEIGKARIRSIKLENGVVGTPSAIYRVYLFDIRMSSGKNFKDIRSIYSFKSGYPENKVMFADIILENLDGASSKNLLTTNIVTRDTVDGEDNLIQTQQVQIEKGAVLHDFDKNSFIFNLRKSIRSITNIRYVYKTITEDVEVSSSGTASIQNQSSAEWPYVGNLSYDQKRELLIIPKENMISTISIGNASTVTNSGGTEYSVLNATGSNFTANLKEGDYIYVDGPDKPIARVSKIVSDTELQYAPFDALLTGSLGSIYKTYPKNVPIAIAQNSNASATVVGNFLNLNLDIIMSSTVDVDVVHNQRYIGGSSVQKNVNRKAYVKIQANTHPAGVNGPWSLGHSDVFRLKRVYAGANTSAKDITGNFLIDMRQNEEFYDHAHLKKRKSSSYTIQQDDELLVEFDVLTHSSEGVKTVTSYNLNDGLTLKEMDQSGNVMNLIEIPDFVYNNNYYDLRECIDFRPASTNTCPIVTDHTIAPCNPASVNASTRFSNTGKKFPVPESDMFFDYEEYLARNDSVLVNKEGIFEIQVNNDYSDKIPTQMFLYRCFVPPYPNFTENLNLDTQVIVNKNVENVSIDTTNYRIEKHTIVINQISQQVFGYTMEDIKRLESRIEALEYNQNLSLLEDDVKNISITSSVDSTIERFKFGFFVDNFADGRYTLFDDDEHDSTFHEGKLQPASTSVNLKMDLDSVEGSSIDNGLFHYEYDTKSMIAQRFATSGPLVDETGISEEEARRLIEELDDSGLSEDEVRSLIEDRVGRIQINQITQVVGGGSLPTEQVCVVEQEKNGAIAYPGSGATQVYVPPAAFESYVYELAPKNTSLTFYLIRDIPHRTYTFQSNHTIIVEQSDSPNGPWNSVVSTSNINGQTGRVLQMFTYVTTGGRRIVSNRSFLSGVLSNENANARSYINSKQFTHNRTGKRINIASLASRFNLHMLNSSRPPVLTVYNYNHNSDFGNYIRVTVLKVTTKIGTSAAVSPNYILHFCYPKEIVPDTPPANTNVTLNPGPTITNPPSTVSDPVVSYKAISAGTGQAKQFGSLGTFNNMYQVVKYEDGKVVDIKSLKHENDWIPAHGNRGMWYDTGRYQKFKLDTRYSSGQGYELLKKYFEAN